jgi:hypothetical protein
MTSSVVVSYAVKPEALDEHVRLIGAVFAALDAGSVVGLRYEVHRADDGISFVHVATYGEDGTNPLASLAEFQEFTRDLAARVVAPPNASPSTVLASYPSGIGHR